MKKALYIFTTVLFAVIIFNSCTKEDDPSNYVNPSELYDSNESKITISQGVAGTLIVTQGNCMPVVSDQETSCSSYPVKRKIYIYEYTTINDVEGEATFYTSVNTKKVDVVKSDNNGFFQVELEPGNYSLFAYEDNKYYANSFNGVGGICSVEVTENSVSNKNITIDYAVY